MNTTHKHRNQCPPRTGFTVLELLVTLAVISLVMALILPAVESTRESARRLQCQDHLRSLGIATQAHISQHGVLPETHVIYGMGSPPRVQHHPGMSPLVWLLPFLDQTALWQSLDSTEIIVNTANAPTKARHPGNAEALRTNVATFLCPSDSPRPGATNYRACTGPGVGLPGRERSRARCRDALSGLGAFAHARTLNPGEIKDGFSHTVFYSERVLGGQDSASFNGWRDVMMYDSIPTCDTTALLQACRSQTAAPDGIDSFTGSTWLLPGYRFTWYNHVEGPNPRHSDCAAGNLSTSTPFGSYAARSLHPGGVNVAFGDGAVRFVNEQIDLRPWQAWSTRNKGEITSDSAL